MSTVPPTLSGPSASAPTPVAATLRFGPGGRFELQAAERRLFVDGRPAALGARALDLLIALVTQPDHLLTKNELLDRVWPGLVVEEANLQMQVSNLRKLLGPEAIATVPGRGYRFVARIAAGGLADSGAAQLLSEQGQSAPGQSEQGRSAQGQSAQVPSAREQTAQNQPSTPVPAGVAAGTAADVAAPHPAQRLFGRTEDLAMLETLLAESRCVTLVGTAGVGKTSLARNVAARWNGRSTSVDLAQLSHGDEVPGAVARALGLQAGDDAAGDIALALRDTPLLLILDNAEHVVQAAAGLAARLLPLPALRLFVTSQLPLNVAGEQSYRLQPLPPQNATALLVERIVAANHRFVATPAALPLLQAICEQLDGLPLALEMAAVRVPALGLTGVRDALTERFAVLTRGMRDAAPRHKTLRSALEWSYRLLGDAEQRLFRAFGVFSGGFTLDLAVELAGAVEAAADEAGDERAGAGRGDDGRWDTIDRLAVLVEHSLVSASGDDPPRFRLLESMRAFALEQAAALGEEQALRRRHAGVVRALFARYSLDCINTNDGALLALCMAEMDNAREAVAWAREHDLETAVRIAAPAASFSTFSVWRAENTKWLLALEALMDAPAGRSLPPLVQATYWSELSRQLLFRREPRSSALAEKAFGMWDLATNPRSAVYAAAVWVRSLSDPGEQQDRAVAALQTAVGAAPDLSPRMRLNVHGAMALALDARGDLEGLLAARQAEVALATELGFDQGAIAAETNVVETLLTLGRNAEAVVRADALATRLDAGQMPIDGNVPYVLYVMYYARMMVGRLDEAQADLARFWEACARFGVAPFLSVGMQAWLAVLRGRHADAALLAGFGQQMLETTGRTLPPTDQGLLADAERAARATLGDAEAERLIAAGRKLDEGGARKAALGG